MCLAYLHELQILIIALVTLRYILHFSGLKVDVVTVETIDGLHY